MNIESIFSKVRNEGQDTEDLVTIKKEWETLEAKLVQKLRGIKQDGKRLVIVEGGKSRLITDVLLLDIVKQLDEEDWLAEAIRNRVRLGDEENKRSYLIHFIGNIKDLPSLHKLLRKDSATNLQFVFIDDHGSSFGKANGTVNRISKDTGIQTDFIYLTAPSGSSAPKENSDKIFVLYPDTDFFQAMSAFSLRLSRHMSEKIPKPSNSTKVSRFSRILHRFSKK